MDKIKNTINQIDPTKTSLEWIYCHYFQSYTRPNQYWIFDETVSIINNSNCLGSLLEYPLMIIPNDNNELDEDNLHWDKDLP